MASPRTGWLALTFVFTGIYGFIGVREAFVSEYFIHDDVRSHVFWMRRFLDPELFPGDIIADYLQSVAPYGYSALYRGMASLGIDPVGFNKILPIFLAFMTTWFCFRLCLRLFPVPAAAFVATVFLNQTLWVTHDLSSGTPRAFIYPPISGILGLFTGAIALTLLGCHCTSRLVLSPMLVFVGGNLKFAAVAVQRRAISSVSRPPGLLVLGSRVGVGGADAAALRPENLGVWAGNHSGDRQANANFFRDWAKRVFL
ncbi:MAG: hypothetical protein HC890_17960 [Chloroflexaceae bacterium]|nr:hypothetical protein [Chloroflexaceae bacterium]